MDTQPLIGGARHLFYSQFSAERFFQWLARFCADLQWLDFNDQAVGDVAFDQLLAGEHIRQAFARTSVASLEPQFVDRAMRRARAMRNKHAVLVFGRAGAGKSSLVNIMRAHEGPRAPVEFPRNRLVTREAHAYKMRTSFLDLHSVLIDTKGWTPDGHKTLVHDWQRVLKSEEFADHRFPSMFLFVMSAHHLCENDEHIVDLRKAFADFFKDAQVTVSVLPVVTFADSVLTVRQLKQTAADVVGRALCGSGARIADAVVTVSTRLLFEQAQPGDGDPEAFLDVGDDELTSTICQMLRERQDAEMTRKLWLQAMADDLQKEAMSYSHRHFLEDTEWRVFDAAWDAITKACNKQLQNSMPARSRTQAPPWWVLREIPRPRHFVHDVGRYLHRKLSSTIYIIIVLVSLVATVRVCLPGQFVAFAENEVTQHFRGALNASSEADVDHLRGQQADLRHHERADVDDLRKQLKLLQAKLREEKHFRTELRPEVQQGLQSAENRSHGKSQHEVSDLKTLLQREMLFLEAQCVLCRSCGGDFPFEFSCSYRTLVGKKQFEGTCEEPYGTIADVNPCLCCKRT
mmetsp:Transcript_74361/g.240387  ORF Transcript_74361/g.240387 Transcript_74361/m.240387 type:complete len:574 (+) Transcript_74361:98-1819(+)